MESIVLEPQRITYINPVRHRGYLLEFRQILLNLYIDPWPIDVHQILLNLTDFHPIDKQVDNHNILNFTCKPGSKVQVGS